MDVTDGSSQFPIPACTGAQISTPRNAALPLTPLFPYCWITALRILRPTEPNCGPNGEG